MNRILPLALLPCLLFLTGMGGDVVNNGNGLAEQNVLFAWIALPASINACWMNQQACGLMQPEFDLLQEILDSLPEEQRGQGIQFKSGRENPGLFEVDESGQPRTAVTGSLVGAPVIFNLDRIYPDPAHALDVPTATAILVHELGHHHGVKDHAWLDRVGAKVKAFLDQYADAISLARMSKPHLALTAFNSHNSIVWAVGTPAKPVFARLLYSNGADNTDWTQPLASKLGCERPGMAPAASVLQNLHWLALPAYGTARGLQTLKWQGTLDWRCETVEPSLESDSFSATVDFAADFDVKGLSYGRVVEPDFSPSEWLGRSDATLVPRSVQVTLSECQRLGRGGEPTGPCAP